MKTFREIIKDQDKMIAHLLVDLGKFLFKDGALAHLLMFQPRFH